MRFLERVVYRFCFLGPTGTRMGAGSRALRIDYILCYTKNDGELARFPMTEKELALYENLTIKGSFSYVR